VLTFFLLLLLLLHGARIYLYIYICLIFFEKRKETGYATTEGGKSLNWVFLFHIKHYNKYFYIKSGSKNTHTSSTFAIFHFLNDLLLFQGGGGEMLLLWSAVVNTTRSILFSNKFLIIGLLQ